MARDWPLLLSLVAALSCSACGEERTSPAHPPARRDAGTARNAKRVALDAGTARAVIDAAVAPPTPPPPPPGPEGEGPVLRVRGLPPSIAEDAGFEPIEMPWRALESLLVATDAVSLGTRQSFAPLSERPWGARPTEPFAFRKEAEPLAQPGYWHPIPRLSILLVPHDPLGAGGPNVAFYALAEGGVRFIRAFPDHGLACAGGATLVEGLAIHSGGADVRRLYGCDGLGEEGTIDIVRLDGRRLVGTVLHGSFLVHRD